MAGTDQTGHRDDLSVDIQIMGVGNVENVQLAEMAAIVGENTGSLIIKLGTVINKIVRI